MAKPSRPGLVTSLKGILLLHLFRGLRGSGSSGVASSLGSVTGSLSGACRGIRGGSGSVRGGSGSGVTSSSGSIGRSVTSGSGGIRRSVSGGSGSAFNGLCSLFLLAASNQRESRDGGSKSEFRLHWSVPRTVNGLILRSNNLASLSGNQQIADEF
jgi:hypothetical protein